MKKTKQVRFKTETKVSGEWNENACVVYDESLGRVFEGSHF